MAMNTTFINRDEVSIKWDGEVIEKGVFLGKLSDGELNF